MRVQICPKCGTVMNAAFALFKKDERKILLQCPKCHKEEDPESGIVETIYIPEPKVELHAGAEGIEARVGMDY